MVSLVRPRSRFHRFWPRSKLPPPPQVPSIPRRKGRKLLYVESNCDEENRFSLYPPSEASLLIPMSPFGPTTLERGTPEFLLVL